ncbi:MAG: DUF2914 domain-containing protein [Deltaproteobacteria bacterium]|nr:DUF2914 domain-containing protein [Deltaproteobacteria bacterium]
MNQNDTKPSFPMTSLARRAAAFALVAGLALVGCGDDDRTPRDESASATVAPTPRPAPEPPANLATVRPTAEPESILDAPDPTPEPEVERPSVDGLDVRRVAVARDIEGREPVDPDTTFFAEDAKLYAHFELTNREGTEDRHPMVVFVGPDGQDRGLIELDVPAGAPRWRTWAYSSHIQMPGDWRVELRDEEGRVLTDHEFTIEE